jgi:hypothetical protein
VTFYIDWSKKFSSQKEIHQYMQHVSKKYGIYEQTQFETKVVGAVWLEDKKQWELELHQPTVHKNNQIKHFDFLLVYLFETRNELVCTHSIIVSLVLEHCVYPMCLNSLRLLMARSSIRPIGIMIMTLPINA